MPLSSLSQPVYVAKAELFRALGHPMRIRILELLATGEQSVSQLARDTGLDSSPLSQHLAVVKRNGLVLSRREGNSVTYFLADASVANFLTTAREVLALTLGRARQTLEELESGDR
jgi:ArsR family transcriptional regulator